ncbi:ABC transporter ATP-binding protein [Alicyclobacillus fastidiosus]|uniref:ABC transporter ATP-binding protein n=1 Tax=Alicyclobacillus fastidiosus TaxID=392011 RepID=A0ABV5A9A7_9BACL|nr:ABC transporter ATP-binding protein [Alicyclobacillus fastidiosus]WEH10789.1 ABC transporter ATP-binding protein [Alicyclobacillus fastidiosus]
MSKVEAGARPEPQKAGMSSLGRLLPYARPYLWQFVLVLVLVVIFNASTVMQPYLVKVAIDSDISTKHPSYHGLLVIALIYVGVVIVGVVANFAQTVLLQNAGQNVIRSIRLSLFSHIERQAMRFFDTRAVGRLVTNVSNDTETVSQFFTNFFLSLIRDGLSIVMIVFAMFQLNARIALYCMVIIPIIFIISALFRGRLRRAYQTTRTRLSNVNAFLAENLAGMRIIQIFHQEQRQSQAFEALNESHRQANVHEYRTSVWFNRAFEILGNVAVAAVVWIGGGAVLRHWIEFGTLYAFIRYIQQFFQPINAMTQQWNTLQSSMVAADRIGQVLAVRPEIEDALDPVHIRKEEIRGRVEFEHVTFGYKPGQTVLKDIHFTIEPGQFIGVVGATGAGKSSVMGLLTRFYEPQKGTITVDGVSIDAYSQEDLHAIIGIVQQDVSLFTGTVKDNIRLFRQEISDETVRHAAEVVGADTLISRLARGYETELYGKGSNLSAGERQLISFARIVALNPRVLILDEATASLDSQTEELVQRGLRAVATNRTTIVIAHRLSTIRHADKILVLDKGRLVEQGTHSELVKLGGLYAALDAQSGVDVEQ